MNPMLHAIESAREGVDKKEGGPFGACIMRGDEVISIAHNTVLKDCDPTCHAEMNAIRMAARKIKNHVLSECTLYTTAEPCPMCLGAIYWARINKVVIGVNKSTAANFGFDDDYFYKELSLDAQNRSIKFEAGVMSKECEDVFIHWQSLAGDLY